MSRPLPQTLEIAPMGENDLDRLVAIEAAVQNFPWSAGNFRDSQAAGHSIWVLRSDEAVLGFAITLQVLDEAHLLNIGLAGERHGEGLGARLLQHAIDVCRGQGAIRMFLEVRPSNARAVALYQRFDFRHVGTRKAYYPALDGREDALIFAKEPL